MAIPIPNDAHTEPTRTPEITGAICEMHGLTIELGEVVAALEKKLSPVVSPYPEVEKADNETTAPHTQLGSEIKSANARIAEAITRLGTLVSRIEI